MQQKCQSKNTIMRTYGGTWSQCIKSISTPHKPPLLIQGGLPLHLALYPILPLPLGTRALHAPRLACHRCQARCQCSLAGSHFC